VTPLAVVVSDDPLVRIQQAKSFFERNPGIFELGRTHPLPPGVKGAAPSLGSEGLGTVTRYGTGQAFVDQVRWQIRTGRQPMDPWWMRMNRRSLEDPLLAEAYVRAGRRDQLVSPVLQAWAGYLALSDEIRTTLGTPVGEGYVGPAAISPAGSIADAHLATGSAGRTASRAVQSQLHDDLFPRARRAYWDAHNKSIQAAFHEFQPLLEQSRAEHPLEAEVQDAWGRFIDFIPKVQPAGHGMLADFLQGYILPQQYPATPESMGPSQWAFLRFAQLVGRKDGHAPELNSPRA
jgi:hypothetical protein